MLQPKIDEKSRRLLGLVCESLAAKVQGSRPSRRLLSDLYLRVRRRLRESLDLDHESLAEELTLEIYFAWLADDDPPDPAILPVLRSSISSALQSLGGHDGS